MTLATWTGSGVRSGSQQLYFRNLWTHPTGIYTVSLIQLGERFSGQALIAGNAAFALVWGIGGIVGSPATGLAMQLIGHQGLPSSLGLLCFVLAMFLVAERRRI